MHVIVITESWLSRDIPDAVVQLHEYNIIRNDRNANGGGVAIYIHDSCVGTIIATSVNEWAGKPGRPEYLFCTVKVAANAPIFVGAVYRPPHAPFNVPNEFASVLSTAMEGYNRKLIFGDFNADMLSRNFDSKYINTLMHDLSSKLVDHGSTHVTSTSATWLDLCLVDTSNTVTAWDKSVAPLAAGHHLISASMLVDTIRPGTKTIISRQLARLQDAHALDHFMRTDWSSHFVDVIHLDESTAAFSRALIERVDQFAPPKPVTVNSVKLAPWLADDLKASNKDVQRLYRRYKRSRIPQRFASFVQARATTKTSCGLLAPSIIEQGCKGCVAQDF